MGTCMFCGMEVNWFRACKYCGLDNTETCIDDERGVYHVEFKGKNSVDYPLEKRFLGEKFTSKEKKVIMSNFLKSKYKAKLSSLGMEEEFSEKSSISTKKKTKPEHTATKEKEELKIQDIFKPLMRGRVSGKDSTKTKKRSKLKSRPKKEEDELRIQDIFNFNLPTSSNGDYKLGLIVIGIILVSATYYIMFISDSGYYNKVTYQNYTVSEAKSLCDNPLAGLSSSETIQLCRDVTTKYFLSLAVMIIGFILLASGIVQNLIIYNKPNSKQPKAKDGDKNPLKILKIRYAKGEITKNEFEEMKEDLKS